MPAIRKPSWVRQEEAISEALKIGLVKKGWSLTHLAAILNKDIGSVSKIINHPAKVKSETVWIIAEKLGLDSLPIIR